MSILLKRARTREGSADHFEKRGKCEKEIDRMQDAVFLNPKSIIPVTSIPASTIIKYVSRSSYRSQSILGIEKENQSSM